MKRRSIASCETNLSAAESQTSLKCFNSTQLVATIAKCWNSINLFASEPFSRSWLLCSVPDASWCCTSSSSLRALTGNYMACGWMQADLQIILDSASCARLKKTLCWYWWLPKSVTFPNFLREWNYHSTFCYTAHQYAFALGLQESWGAGGQPLLADN